MSKSVLIFVAMAVAIVGLLVVPRFLKRESSPSHSVSSESSVTPHASPSARPETKNAPSANPKQEIARVFGTYRSALLQGDGQSAWSVVDSHTQKSYSKILDDALSLRRPDFDRLDFMHKLMVLRLRNEMRREQLQALDGKNVFVMGVTNGWISFSDVQSMEKLHAIKVEGRYGSASLPQAPTTPVLFFIQEGPEWKLALWKGFEMANSTMQKMRQESGLSEPEYLTQLLNRVSKNAVDPKVFDGPID